MTSSILGIRKWANAFIVDAAPSESLLPEAVWAATRFKRKHGGLWVGGTVSVSHGGVSFSPNAVNRAVHVGLEPVEVPAADIRSVRYEFGWVTGIVVLGHAQGELRLRCFGARRLARAMAAVFHLR